MVTSEGLESVLEVLGFNCGLVWTENIVKTIVVE